MSRLFVFDVSRARSALQGLQAGLRADLMRMLVDRCGPAADPISLVICGTSDPESTANRGSREGVFIRALLDEWGRALRERRPVLVDEAMIETMRAEWGDHRLHVEFIRRGRPVELFSVSSSLVLSPPAERRDPAAVDVANPAQAPTRRWYGMAPSFRRRLGQEVSPTAAVLYGVEIEGINGAELWEVGASRDLEWRRGVPLCVLDWAALLAMDRRSELERCLNAISADQAQEELPYLLYLFYIRKDRDRARYELDKAHQKAAWIEPAILLVTGFGDPMTGRRYLAECSGWPDRDARFLVQCARAWHVFFDDTRESARCLEQAGQRILDAQDAESVAAGMADFRRDTRLAWKYLGHGESLATGSRDWVVCASGWIRVFDDQREGARCLRNAERAAVTARDWLLCASGQREWLGDANAARAALENAEGAAHEVWEWQDCAERWVHLFMDEERGRHCLDLAEQLSGSFSEWRECAVAWARLLKDTIRARACLAQAEEYARDAVQWEICAEDWADLLKDAERAERCRAHAEHLKSRR